MEARGDSHSVKCIRCGDYRISGSLAPTLDPNPAERAALSAAIRDASRRGTVAVLTNESWRNIAARFQNFSLPQKLRRLLEHVGNESDGVAGTQVKIDGELDYPLFAARNNAEYHWLRQALTRQELVTGDANVVALTLKGWEAFRPLSGTVPHTCFVAMAFDRDLDFVYDEGIRPAVEDDCGYSVLRIDRVQHNENINDKIIADLRACQFAVADFTRQKAGVYFEAGFALGLGKTVIWTCQKSEFGTAHFDTRPYNHLLWETAGELREKLKHRILATDLPGFFGPVATGEWRRLT